VILNHNYFQYKDKYFKPTKDIALGSPISSTLAEIYHQFFEERTIRHWMENGEINYRRYGDDIIIIFDKKKLTKNLSPIT
jgi:CRISPR/Cas system CMR-associated protein Cmr5 small subunit